MNLVFDLNWIEYYIEWNVEELLLHQNLDIWWEKNNDIKIKTTWSCL